MLANNRSMMQIPVFRHPSHIFLALPLHQSDGDEVNAGGNPQLVDEIAEGMGFPPLPPGGHGGNAGEGGGGGADGILDELEQAEQDMLWGRGNANEADHVNIAEGMGFPPPPPAPGSQRGGGGGGADGGLDELEQAEQDMLWGGGNANEADEIAADGMRMTMVVNGNQGKYGAHGDGEEHDHYMSY